MITRLLALFFLALTSISADAIAAEKTVSLHMSWTLNSKSGVWTNDDVRVSFPEARAGFTRKSAEPFRKDGTAVFSYFGKRGVITFYLGHRLLEGYPTASALRDGYLTNMHKE
jgi:hypothetical protein